MTAATASTPPSCAGSAGSRRRYSRTACARPSAGTSRTSGGGARSRSAIPPSRPTTRRNTSIAADPVAGPVLVTGAGGFAGSHLIELLSASGLTPVGWVRSRQPALQARATWAQVDLLDRDRVRAAIAHLKPAV